jgi:hypothetical protein
MKQKFLRLVCQIFDTTMAQLFFIFFPFFILPQSNEKSNSGILKAVEFLSSLNDYQRKRVLLAFDEMNRYEWHYLPASYVPRNGINVSEMNSDQKKNLYAFMQSYLSERGLTRTKNIMSFEAILRELEGGNSSRIPENYFIAIYGMPGKDSTWGWKFSGHHLALNFTIVNGKLAFAPFFFGVNPAEVKEGPHKGTRLIKEEEDLGFELVNSLTPNQKQKAMIRENAFGDILTTASKEVEPLVPAGIFAKDFTLKQKDLLNKLIVAYLLSMPADISKIRMQKIAAEDMNTISFGWAGATEPGKPHYYRVQGKSFLIEFDNTQNRANHIHSVWRDFNGDFGRDLLKEHYSISHDHDKTKGQNR